MVGTTLGCWFFFILKLMAKDIGKRMENISISASDMYKDIMTVDKQYKILSTMGIGLRDSICHVLTDVTIGVTTHQLIRMRIGIGLPIIICLLFCV